MRHDQEHFGWDTFKTLPAKKKLEHIFYYYKWYILGAVALIWMLVSLAGAIAGNRKEVLISGMFINTATDQPGYDSLEQGYWQYCGGSDDTRVDLVTYRHIDFAEGAMNQEDAASFMVLTSMLAARTLDYIITDQATLAYLQQQEVVLDLAQVFPPEELEGYDIIYLDGVPSALRLAGSAFAENHPLSSDTSCLLLVASTQDAQKGADFIRYVMGR